MNYSPIKSIRTKNFMCLGDVVIDMTQSPIVSLIGENDSGKTSFIKSVAVCAANINELEQKGYIRGGTAGFGVAIELEDGSRVVRMKRKDANIYEVEVPGKEKWSVSKIDRGYGAPKQVEDVMGFVVEPETKELLNMRTYEDKCLFVFTKASENYKVWYNALKVDNISRAIKEGTKEANKDKSEINSYERSIDVLENNLNKIQIVDIEPALKMREIIKRQLSQIEKLERAVELIEENKRLADSVTELEKLNSLNEVSEVEVNMLSTLNIIMERNKQLIDKNELYIKAYDLSEIDYSVEEKMLRVMKLTDETSNKEKVMGVYEDVANTVEVNEQEINDFDRVMQLINTNKNLESKLDTEADNLSEIDESNIDILESLNKIYQYSYRLNKLDEYSNQLEAYGKQFEDALKEMGVKVVNCPKCGEEIIMDSDEDEVCECV